MVGRECRVVADCSLSPARGSEPLAVHVAANGLARARRRAAGLVATQRRDSRFPIGFATPSWGAAFDDMPSCLLDTTP